MQNRILIKNIKKNETNSVAGFIETIRDKKNICFIILRDISSKLQITIDKIKHPELITTISKLTIDSVIKVEGIVVKSEFVKLNNIELLAEKIEILSVSKPSPILAPEGCETNIDLRLDYRWIDLRTEKNTLLFKVQTELIGSFRNYLLNKDFIEIHSPKIISTESESGAGVFEVNYFDRKAYLAQSPQFYKQMAMAAGFEKIFETGPVFRAEKSNSRKHATEFSGFDIEISYIDSFYDIMALEEELIIEGLKNVKEKYGDDIKRIYNIDVVIPKVPFPIIDLKDLYKELENRYNYHVDDSEKGDLTTEGERLCERFSKDKYNSEFLFVTGYSANNRAFYHMRDKNGVPCGYDLIWKGVEITTGAQREHRYDILSKQAEEKGLKDDVKDYLKFFEYGCPPHGGFGIGIDRLTMILFNLSIKEVMFLFRGPDKLTP